VWEAPHERHRDSAAGGGQAGLDRGGLRHVAEPRPEGLGREPDRRGTLVLDRRNRQPDRHERDRDARAGRRPTEQWPAADPLERRRRASRQEDERAGPEAEAENAEQPLRVPEVACPRQLAGAEVGCRLDSGRFDQPVPGAEE
jgi:hypothetical protein